MKNIKWINFIIFFGCVTIYFTNWELPYLNQGLEEKPDSVVIIPSAKYSNEVTIAKQTTSKVKSVPHDGSAGRDQEPGFGLSMDSLNHLKHAGPGFLKAYRNIKIKALISENERQSYQESLQNINTIRASKKLLLQKSRHLNFGIDRKNRWQAVTFLADGLRWKNNPERIFLLRIILKIIRYDNIKQQKKIIMRKSLAKDKVALILALNAWAPEQIEKLYEKQNSEIVNKILSHGLNAISNLVYENINKRKNHE